MKIWFILFIFIILASNGCAARLFYIQQAPRAQLVPEYLHTWNCTPFVGCTLNGTLHNNGNGCANHVAAYVRLFNQSGLQIGKGYSWRLPHQQIVDPKDDIHWHVDFVPLVIAQDMQNYDINVDWMTTPCNVGAGWLGRRHVK